MTSIPLKSFIFYMQKIGARSFIFRIQFINRLSSDSNLSLGSCLGGIICYPPRCSACASFTFMMCCAICYHLCNSKNVKTSHGRVLFLVKLQASTCNFTKSSFPPWVFITFFKLYKWYQIAQRIRFLKLFDQNE